MAIEAKTIRDKEDIKYYQYQMSIGGGLKVGEIYADRMIFPKQHPNQDIYLTYLQAKQVVMDKDGWLRVMPTTDPYLFSFGTITRRNWAQYEKWLERRVKYPSRYNATTVKK